MLALEQSIQIRVCSCQRLISDVCERLACEEVHPRIKDQLKRLTEVLCLIDQEAVSEDDLHRIETATNRLMEELAMVFTHQGIGCLYNMQTH